ncbi:hypothetical protein RB593_003818 [Gaeumannomyces tritici]
MSFDEIFHREPTYGIAVCREHGSAVTGASVERHIARRHKLINAKKRQDIVQEAVELQAQGALASSMAGVRFPKGVVAPVEWLAVLTDGKQCVTCRYILRTKEDMQRHCRKEHGWVNTRGRGGKPGAEPPGGVGVAWVDGVHCQRFGQAGAMQRLFEVERPAAPAPTGDGGTADERGDVIVASFKEAMDRKKRRRRAAAALIEEQSRQSPDQWVRRTGWSRHLRGFDRDWLAATAAPPAVAKKEEEDGKEMDPEAREKAESEAALGVATLAMERVVWWAQRASHVEVVGSAAVNFVERREAGGESNEKPFHAGQKGQTMERYVETWKGVMAYIWRTHGLAVGRTGSGDEGGRGEDEGEDEEGEDVGGQNAGGAGAAGSQNAGGQQQRPAMRDKRPPYEFTEQQRPAMRDKRPPYEFTERQARAFRNVREVAHGTASGNKDAVNGDVDTDELERHVLEFFIALFDHDIQDNEFQNALYSGLAVLGIQPGHGWRSALVFTPRLSAVVTVTRMLVLYRAHRDREDEVRRRREERGEGEEEAKRNAVGHFPRVQEMVRRFMTIVAYDGRPTPMDSILRLRAYGRAIRANTNAEGLVDWHGDTLLFGSVQLSMASLRAMVHGLLHEARVGLRRDVLLVETDEEGELVDGTALPIIRWDRLVDNAAETREGWSFVEDPRNQAAFGPVHGEIWLAERIAREERLRAEFIGDRGRNHGGVAAVGWRTERVRKYAEAMRQFRAQLFALVHMTGGQPARGTELVTVQYVNGGSAKDIRGVFIESGLVAFVTMYNKTMAVSAKAKVIHRYLPQEVGELVVYYVWLAIPFWQGLVDIGTGGQAEDDSPYIWVPRPDDPYNYPGKKKAAVEEEGRAEQPQGDGRLRSRARRGQTGQAGQAGQASQSQGQGQGQGQGQDDAASEDGQNRPENASRAPDWWEPEQWNTGRASRALAKVSLKHVGEKIGLMTWRHSVKAIYRRFIRDKGLVDMLENADEAEGEKGAPLDEAFHAQSGHSRGMGEQVYGRTLEEHLSSTEARRIAFRKASREWHAFLMFESVLREGVKGGPSRLVDVTRQATEEEDRRWRAMRHVDLDAQLRRLLGEGAGFRGVQRPALEAIMRQASPVVVVMGTGGGKSMLFMLPASCANGGLTVVVVPLVSLRGDVKDRCDELGIECVEWNAGRPHEWASVVLVTPESAVGESFGHFVNRQRAMGRLDRIVVDECHVVLDSGAGGSWRTRVLGLRGLVKAETQLVYLTATLRPADEAEFGRLVGLPPRKGTRWFRAATTRANVAYRVVRFDAAREEEEDVVAALVEKRKKELGAKGRIIVYCDTVKKTVRYGKRLGAACYHRNVGTAEKKREIVRQLKEGRQQVFTATNALGLGVDAPTIRVVVHVGVVRRLRDYAQESGRAGRDGAASEAIIVKAARQDRRGRAIKETAEQAAERGVERAMWEFTETEGCVRVVLDREMDGREDREGCEKGEQACYRCGESGEDGDMEGGGDVGRDGEGEGDIGYVGIDGEDDVDIFRGRAQRKMYGWQERIRQAGEVLEVVRLEEIMESWSSCCVWCRLRRTEGSGDHRVEGCRAEGAEDARRAIERLQGDIRWEAYSGCFDCGMPQAVCRRFEEVGSTGGFRRKEDGWCQHAGVLVRAVAVMWLAMAEEADEWFRGQMEGWGIKWEGDVEQVTRWMGRKIRWGGLESNEMCRAAVKLYEMWSGIRVNGEG